MDQNVLSFWTHVCYSHGGLICTTFHLSIFNLAKKAKKNPEIIVMDSEILWDILKFPDWESGTASFTWLKSGKAIESGKGLGKVSVSQGKNGGVWTIHMVYYNSISMCELQGELTAYVKLYFVYILFYFNLLSR